MNLFYNEKPVSEINKAIRMYGGKEFRSPTRSTLPLLSWLKWEQPMMRELFQGLGIPAECSLHLEYKVAPPQGKGEASHTDLMVISGASWLAVEAKWTEPRYETVGEWLEKGGDNRRDVLAGWLGLLQKHARRTLGLADFSEAIYQMVHRAASACKVGHTPKLAYLIFEPSPDPKTAAVETMFEDLTHLWDLLGKPEKFPFYLIEMRWCPTHGYGEIASLPKGHESTAQRVIGALCEDARLFDFAGYRVRKVGEEG